MTLATEIDIPLNNGQKIPALGLGTVPPEDPSEVKNQVITAVKAGYRHIDTAWKYGTEKYVGEALKELFDNNVVKREDLFITTKYWPTFYDNPEKSLDISLSALGLEYVDLFLQHWPVAFKSDANGEPPVPRDSDGKILFDDDPVDGKKFIESYQKLEKVLETSKTKSIGVSNYSIPKLRQLLKVAKYKPVVNQIEYHPQLPLKDLIQFNEENNIVILAYSPVGSNGAPVLKVPLIKQLAQKYEVTENEIAQAYHILEGRAVLPRSSNLERIKTIIRLPQLTKDEIQSLYQIGVDNPVRYINEDWGIGIGLRYWKNDTLSKEFD